MICKTHFTADLFHTSKRTWNILDSHQDTKRYDFGEREMIFLQSVY